MKSSQLEIAFKMHLNKEEKIWKDLEDKLYQKYLKQGYYMWWARQRAGREVLELRSNPVNIHQMPDKIENLGDLD